MSVADGLYELRPYINTKLALDIQGASKTQGAKGILYACTGADNQKFDVKKHTSGGTSWWSIDCLDSGMALSTEKSYASSGDGVVQWVAEAANWCRWTITETEDTATVEGKAGCKVVKIAPLSGAGLLLDASDAMRHRMAKTVTEAANSPEADYQLWVLYPTTRYWSSGPMPFEGKMSVTAKGDTYAVHDTTESIYPSFRIPASWLSHDRYHWRWSVRDMSPEGRWGAWSDGAGGGEYTPWEEPTTVRKGDRVWVIGSEASSPATWPMDATYAFSECKHRQFFVQVRCQDDYSDGYTWVSPTYGFYIDICKRPTFTFTDAVMSPLGLSLEFGTDYLLGPNRLKLVKVGGWRGSHLIECLTDGQDILLPIDMVGWLSEGTGVALEWYVGNDQHAMHGGSRNNDGNRPTVSYTGGSIDISYTEVGIDEWGIATITVKDSNGVRSDSRVWVEVDGNLTEFCGSGGTFTGLVTSASCTVFAVAGGSSSYGMWSHAYENLRYSASHALFTADGKMLVIGLREGSPIAESHSLSAIYDATALDAREREAVRFAPTRKSAYTIEGAIVDAVSNFGLDDIDALVGEHVSYRTPTGRFLACAVVGVSTVAHAQWSEVSISLVEETV